MAYVLELLGGFRLLGAEGKPVPLPDRRARALLAYLALAAGPSPRHLLAELLGAEGDDQDHRTALRQAIYVARKAVSCDGAIVASDAGVVLSDRLVRVDARRFLEAVADGGEPALAEAVELYRGPFLAGERASSPAFEEWLGARRRDLLEKAMEALLRLAAADEAAGRHGRALLRARRALELDCLREDAHRQAMRSLAAMGQRAAALRQFEIARRALADELGVPPEGATAALRHAISRGTDTVASVARYPSPVASMAVDGELETADRRDTGAPPFGITTDAVPATAPSRLAHARRLSLAAVTLLGLSGGVLWATGAPTSWRLAPAAAPARLSVVVLPFANLSGSPEEEYFADGITDDLTTDLSRIDGSLVIARHTAFTYKGRTGIDLRELGRELGVRYVLEGGVRRGGERVGVNARLVDAASGAQLWAERFEGARERLPTLYDEVTGRIAATLRLELIGAEGRRAERERRPDSDALDDAMRGWALLHRINSREHRAVARLLFEHALASDPDNVSALIGLAHVLEGRSDRPAEDRQRALDLLRRALDLEPNRADAHYVLGLVRRALGQMEEAADALRTAIALDRNYARAHLQLGMTVLHLGRPEEAIAHARRAMRLNPRDPNLADHFFVIGLAHQLLGRVGEAINYLERARAANPRLWYIHWFLAGAYGSAHRLNDAKQALAEQRRLRPEFGSIAAIRAAMPQANHPAFQALCERTAYVGLRRAGFPDG